MSVSDEIDKLNNQIENQIQNRFMAKLDEVRSFCESKIEELLFLQIIYHLQDSVYWSYEMELKGIEFIVDNKVKTFIVEGEFKTDYESISWIEKKNYRFNGVDWEKYHGVKINLGVKYKKTFDEHGKWLDDVYDDEPLLYRVLEIYPQYKVKCSRENYRLDFAIILKRYTHEDDKIYDERKLGIECDGYEFHKKAYKQDQKRTRDLKAHGFKDVLRYSGSEIYSIGDNLQEIKYNFDEMLKIIML